MRKIRSIFILTAMSICLTACSDPMPELTEEQSALISEYAAGLLLRYSSNYSGKIVSDEQIQAQLEKEALFAENTAAATVKEQKEEAEKKVEDTPAVQENADIAAFLGLSPITVDYHGYEISDSYPNGSEEEMYFSMDATAGKKFVVLKFLVQNNSEEELTADVFSTGTRFKAAVNGEEKSVLTTMLTNDFAGLKETLAPGTAVEAVLISELPEEQVQQIDTLTLVMRKGEEEARSSLN